MTTDNKNPANATINSTTNSTTDYTPPKIWTWEDDESDQGGRFSSVNRPTAGARVEQTLPRGEKPLQLYSLNTPNGIKVNIMLEELAELKVTEAEYDAFQIHILEGDQFGSDFVSINPNSKIPALIDLTGLNPQGNCNDNSGGNKSNNGEVKIFESGAILSYLAEKFGYFIPTEVGQERAEVMSWLMWQMGSAPYVGGGFGHFYHYAPYPMQYPIDRFTMETKRQLDVLDKHLDNHEYLSSYGYSIADMAVFPWYGGLVLHNKYEGGEFLQVHEYKNVIRWAKQIEARPAVQRAMKLELKPIK